MDRLAREALAAQVVVQVEVQRHGVRPRALHAVALQRLQHELHLLGGQGMVLPVDRDRHRSAAAQRRSRRLGIERRHRRRHLRHLLPEPRPQRPVVRLELPAPELLGLAHEPDALHVQLVEQERLEPLDRRPLLARRHDHRLTQRLPHLDLRLRPRGAPELDRLTGDLHVALEPHVAQRLVDRRVVA